MKTAARTAEGGRGVRRGLVFVLGATAVAGVLGYAIQLAVPRFLDSTDYVAFSVFWSLLYLAVSALSGVQQEVTRAASAPEPGAHLRQGSAAAALGWLAAITAGLCVLVVAVSAPLWAQGLFGAEALPLVAALCVGLAGYAAIAVLSGGLYGVRAWGGVAAVTVTDTVLRAVGVGLALIAGAALGTLGWAVCVPFLVAFIAVLLFVRTRLQEQLHLDAGLAALLRHSAATVAAAAATGLMISGLPFLLGLTSTRFGPQLLASVILIVTLSRAPLIVPLLALQSFLVVTFSSQQMRVRRLLAWLTLVAAAALVLAIVAALLGPVLVQLFYGGRYALPAWAYAVIVAGAGTTAMLCVSGPATLAKNMHAAYVAGWAVAAAGTIVGLLWASELWAVTVVLCAAPTAGVAVHATAFAVRHRSRSGAPASERAVE